MKNGNKNLVIIFLILFAGCSSGVDLPLPTPPPPTAKTCIITGITQQNSSLKPEFSLNIQYNIISNPIKVNLFDSAANIQILNANLTYITSDSIIIDAYQYFKLDALKRVTIFVTKEDMTIPNTSDNYRYEYKYSSDGFLITKLLYINGARVPQYTTNYTYSNGQLVNCLMTTSSSDNKKVLESTVSYDVNISPKTMIYIFPDGFESSLYSVALNYGTRPSKPPSKIITKIFDPVSGNILDTWTTNYSGYSLDSNGYLSGGNTSGDQQQGIFTFYGKTNFSYQCK